MKVTAIVIGDNHYNTLGVVRSLGEQKCNVKVILFHSDEHIVEKSRYVKSFSTIRIEKEELIRAIEENLSASNVNVLFPLCDFAAIVCDEMKLKESFNCIIPGAKGKIREYEDKSVANQIAKIAGLLVPRSLEIDLAETEKYDWSIFPAIVKPIQSIEGKKGDICTVENEEELTECYTALKDKGYRRLQVQEFIHGDDSYMVEILGYVGRDGKPHYSDIVKKVREYPIRNGSTSFAEIVKEQQGLEITAVTKMLKLLGFFGIFDIEFKYADGKLFFIEINLRNGAPSYAMTRLGFNIPYSWMCDALQQEAPHDVRTKKKYIMVETRDCVNMLKGYVPFMLWLRDFCTSQKLIWNATDIRPSVISYFDVLIVAFRRIVHG